MADIKLYPSELNGQVIVPPSKSMSHRAIICASLASGTSIIENIDFSDDINSTIKAMKILGAEITVEGKSLYIQGIKSKEMVRKFEYKKQVQDKEQFQICNYDLTNENINFEKNIPTVDCSESGSTLRFIIPIFSALSKPARYIGRGNLGKRPLSIYYKIFDDQNIRYEFKSEELDLTVLDNLKPGEFYIEGNVSSQFISGLIFALPLLNGDSKIYITTEFESKPYLDLTILVLKSFGIDIENKGYREFTIKGNQEYKNCNYRVEGDYSQGAYFLCANALGSDISLSGLKEDSLQGDKRIIGILDSMGTSSKFVDDKLYNISRELTGTTIDASQCPDIIPVLSLVATLSKGETKIVNAHRLKLKECDRLEATRLELLKLGGDIEATEDSLIIKGIDKLRGGINVWSHNDHRIAMMLSIASCFCEEEIVICDSECISKSYPNFYKDFMELGGKIDEWNLGK
ncbi:3-phosphoshikimate 1-carboxyvinyltransferase [Metaclostridioides mangenotii]|uniref:3-phosphoshikimate 1-carboxyvinyltransferase n=1 Tax=Metaclostridioides mangenotii TaxID=1540 RepID=UPI0026F0DD94|nr:3-phosphoshikimate 1-carboxyvinyltransferase [Clostridioides mangenotii]